MQKAKEEFDNNFDAPDDEDDMEKYFYESMCNELESGNLLNQNDQYSNALSKLEEIKRIQNDSESKDQKITEGNQEYCELEDDIEARLMDDINQSLKEEANEERDYQDDKTEFQLEYEELIQEFSYAINSKQRKLISVNKVTEI